MARSKQLFGFTPDYFSLLQTFHRSDPRRAVDFHLMMPQMERDRPVDYSSIINFFLESNMIIEATSFLLDVVPDQPQHAYLRTKVLEINLTKVPHVADSILANGMFSHYDRPYIAKLCEKAGLYMRALQHYSELPDIKHVIVNNSQAIEQQALVEFFGTLRAEWALECMKDLLLVDLNRNLQIIVEVAKAYSEQLGVEACIMLFEQFKSYEGLYLFLGSYLSSSEDPDIHFKFIEAAAKTGQIEEVERATRESNFYDPEKTKNFLMAAKLHDAQPLINVCDRHGFVPDLTHYLYSSNMLRYIEVYVQKVNPKNVTLVVGQLLDDECPEDFMKGLILSVRSLLPFEPLMEECEKRNRLHLLTQLLEHLVSEGSQDVHVHSAMGKLVIDRNNSPQHFLTTNPYYDSRVVGKYSEKSCPTLAVIAYWRGQCDDELINVTNKNSLFKMQARYVVERMDDVLWAKVLDPENEFRRLLIDEVVSTLLESKSPEQVSAALKAFLTADLPVELANASFKKLNLNFKAVNVLLGNRDISGAVKFASYVNEDAVWSEVATAQLREGLVSDAVDSFIRANDATQFLEVIRAAENGNVYHDLERYLVMVRKKTEEPKVDNELIYAYAKIDRLVDIEQLISMPNIANLPEVGDRLSDETLYDAAKIIFAFISNWGKLAITLIKLKQFQGAIDAAQKANSSKTWKEVCFACVDAWEFRLAQICGLNIIVQVDDLEEVSEYYKNRGCFNELISLMESGLGLETAHMGIFTELGVLYARYRHEKLMKHIKRFSTRLNIPKLIRACNEQQHWLELTYLYIQYEEFDNAATTMMNHSPEAWDHMQFKEIIMKVANTVLYCKAVHFYLQEHPDLINDVLNVLAPAPGLYHTGVVDILRKAGHLHLVKPYLVAVQSHSHNLCAVNEALNEIYVEEEDYDKLRESVDLHNNFDKIGFAEKIETHELLEMRRVSAYIYKKAGRWKQSMALSKKDNLYKDAIETASQSGNRKLAEELLVYLVEKGEKEYFAMCLNVCFEIIRPDVALELAWMNNMVDIAFPYLLKFIRECTGKVDQLIKNKYEGKGTPSSHCCCCCSDISESLPPSPYMGGHPFSRRRQQPPRASPLPPPAPSVLPDYFYTLQGHWSLDPSIRQQNACGCCWAIVSAAAASQEFRRNNRDLPDLISYEAAPQELIDAWGALYPGIESWGVEKCQRSSARKAIQYIIQNGIARERDYKFLAKRQEFFPNVLQPHRFPRIKVHAYKNLTTTPQEVIDDILQSRVIVGRVRFTDNFKAWRGQGIYPHEDDEVYDPDPNPTATNNEKWHAVLVTGRGRENGTEFYQIKNSWGHEWGYNGYARIPIHLVDPLFYVDGASLIEAP